MSAANPLGSASYGASDQRPYEPSMEEILASIRRIIADDQNLAGRAPAREAAPGQEPHADDALDVTRFQEELGDRHAGETGSEEGKPPRFDALRQGDAEPALDPEAEASIPAGQGGGSAMLSHGLVSAPQFPMPDRPDLGAPPRSAGIAAPVQDQAESNNGLDHRPEADPKPLVSQPNASATYFDPPAERDEESGAEPAAQLFSEQTMQSVSSAFNMLAATRLADNSGELLEMAREMIKPLLKTWLDDNLPSMVERMVRAEIERVARGR